MIVYRIHSMTEPFSSADYFGTLAEAHTEIKAFPKGQRANWRIDLFDIDTGKAGILELLKFHEEADCLEASKIQRSWAVTARGGLLEVQPGE